MLNDAGGLPRFQLPAPTVKDAAGHSGSATLDLTLTTATITVDPALLASAVYPVTVDPNINYTLQSVETDDLGAVVAVHQCGGVGGLSGAVSGTTLPSSRRRRRASRWFSWVRARMTECSTFVLSFSSACSRRRRASSSSASPREREPGGGRVVGGGTRSCSWRRNSSRRSMARSAVALLTPATDATFLQVSLVLGGVMLPSSKERMATWSLRRLCKATVTE